MYVLYETATGKALSIGSAAVSPVPPNTTLLDIGNDDRLLTGFGYWDPVTKTVKNVVPSPVDRVAAMEALRLNIVNNAITWLKADADAATTRGTNIANAVSTVTARRTATQSFTFNGSNVTNINSQLNTSLKPLLIDMLGYIISLGDIVAGIETWRGQQADPSLVWLARQSTDTLE